VALKFVVRGGAGALLFVAVIDTVRSKRSAATLAGAIVVGGAVSAALGLIVFALGPLGPLGDLVRQQHIVGGVLRLQGTFDYPNTAAVAFEMSMFVALGLAGVAPNRWARLAIGACVLILAAAMLLTFSRGATFGTAAGLASLALLGALAGRRRVTIGATAAIAAVLAATVGVQVAYLPLERLFTESDRVLYGATYFAPTVIRADESGDASATVVVTNTGAATWNINGPDEYHLGYHWLEPATQARLSEGAERARLGTVPPNHSVSVTALISTPTEPGTYLLAWDVAHADVAWFADQGVPVAMSRVDVGPVDETPAPVGQTPTTSLYGDLPDDPTRGELWGAALAMIAEKPLLGVGPGTFRLRYGPYLGREAWNESIHANNLYLELAATTGLVGLVAFLAVVGGSLYLLIGSLAPHRASASSSREGPEMWPLRAALAAGLVAFLAHGVLDYFLGFNGTLGLFWAVLGIALGLTLARTSGRGRPAVEVSASQ
jgi:O-antigen ligase